MIRILHIVSGMNRGGLETLIMSIYREIDRSQVQFDFLVHTDTKGAYEEEIKKLGGIIYRVVPRSKGILKNIRELNIFFANHPEYKIIHYHASSLTYIEPLRIAKKYNVPIRIIHGHSTKQGGLKLHKYLHFINKFKIKKFATQFYTCSEDAANWMYGPHNLFNIKYEIINNGIDSNRFMYSVKSRNRVRDRYNLNNQFVIGHIGRFMSQKNHEFIIDVFNEIHKLEKNSKLMLVGDGNLRSEISSKINNEKLDEAVIFTGVVSNTEEMLNAMDVFLFPSLSEGLGIAVIEAQSTGLKCFVSTEVPKEVMITDNIQRISLKESASKWAEYIIEFKDGYLRQSQNNQIINSNYDIKEVSKSLQKSYLNFQYDNSATSSS